MASVNKKNQKNTIYCGHYKKIYNIQYRIRASQTLRFHRFRCLGVGKLTFLRLNFFLISASFVVAFRAAFHSEILLLVRWEKIR